MKPSVPAILSVLAVTQQSWAPDGPLCSDWTTCPPDTDWWPPATIEVTEPPALLVHTQATIIRMLYIKLPWLNIVITAVNMEYGNEDTHTDGSVTEVKGYETITPDCTFMDQVYPNPQPP